MRLKILALALGLSATGVPAAQAAPLGICGFYQDAYQKEIREKITAGVPFELMSALFEDGQLVDKKSVRVSYNLWDEVIALKSGDQSLARLRLNDGPNELCKYLDMDEQLKNGRHYTYRLLLNPLWGERMMRLQVAANGSSGSSGDSSNKLMLVNWKKLASEMPSDKILLERDLQK